MILNQLFILWFIKISSANQIKTNFALKQSEDVLKTRILFYFVISLFIIRAKYIFNFIILLGELIYYLWFEYLHHDFFFKSLSVFNNNEFRNINLQF